MSQSSVYSSTVLLLVVYSEYCTVYTVLYCTSCSPSCNHKIISRLIEYVCCRIVADTVMTENAIASCSRRVRLVTTLHLARTLD
jgi:hypothetical protein